MTVIHPHILVVMLLKCTKIYKKSKTVPCNRTWRPTGLWDVEDPTLYRHSAHRWRWDYISLIRGPRSTVQKYFLILISVRGWVNPSAIVRLEGLCKLKKSNDLIAAPTCNLPAWVSQPTTLPSVPIRKFIFLINRYYTFIKVILTCCNNSTAICVSVDLCTVFQFRLVWNLSDRLWNYLWSTDCAKRFI
jgi:hypothetical protein